MNRSSGLAALAACLLAAASPASAQLWPSYGYGYGGDVTGAAVLGTDLKSAAAMQAVAQNRQFGQMRTMQQNAVVQNGIRSTLLSQAQAETTRSLQQQQSNQDWWFQYQGQQMAQQRAQAGGRPAPRGRPGTPGRRRAVPPWPPATSSSGPRPCKSGEFAYYRSQIEAPYRRSPPGLSAPTADDYRAMAATIEQMKSVLEWRLQSGMVSEDYQQAKAFLDQLGQEAGQRAGQGSKPRGPNP